MKRVISIIASSIAMTASLFTANAAETEISAVDYEPIVYNTDFFKNITYTWTDSSGNTQTSNLSERATCWEQMQAFIKTIMTNRTIPGLTKDPTPADQIPKTRKKDGKELDPSSFRTPLHYNDAYNEWDIPYGNKIPYEDGMTAIVVRLKHDFNSKISNNVSTKDMVCNYIESMEVMTNRMRIDGDNPGWVFNLRVPINKFFIMSKGKLRNTYEKPFNWMFEQFSPAENDYTPTEVYNQMLKEREYEIKHDCKSSITKYHPTLMGTSDYATDYMSSIFVFIPDNRFGAVTEEDANQEDENGKYLIHDQYKVNNAYPKIYVGEDWSCDANTSYIYYKPSVKPSFFFNTAELSVESIVQPDSPTEPCVVNLTWNTSLGKNFAGTDFMEKFHLYRVVDGQKQLIGSLDELVSVDEYTTYKQEEDGNILFAHSDKTDRNVKVSILEKQNINAYQVDYIVEGTVEYMDISYIDSNIITASIPGYTPLERCELITVGNPTSKFYYCNDKEGNEADYNHYVHAFGLTNNTSYRYPLLAGHINNITDTNKPYFQLTRSTNLDDLLNNENIEYLAKLTITEAYDMEDGYTYFKGKFDSSKEESVLFRSITESGDKAPVEILTDSSRIWFVSEFDEPTKDNLHPDKYYYRLMSNILVYDTDNEQWDYARSAPITIDIPHTKIKTSFDGYSADEILNDADRHLSQSKKNIGYYVHNNSEISTYDVYYNGRKMLARTQQAQDGTFQQSIYTDENANDDSIEEIEAGVQTFDVINSIDNRGGNIVGIITDFNNNTYGTGRADIPNDIELTGGIVSIYQDSKNERAYVIDAKWQPINSEDDQKYLTHNHLYNAWLALNDSPNAVNVYDKNFWDEHDDLIQIVNVADRLNTRQATQSSTETVEYTCTPDWRVGPNSYDGEYPLVASILVRYYPQIANTDDGTAQYGVMETYYSSATYGDGDVTTGIDEIDANSSHHVEIYSLQGIRLASYEAEGTITIALSANDLPTGIYIARIDNQAMRIKLK